MMTELTTSLQKSKTLYFTLKTYQSLVNRESTFLNLRGLNSSNRFASCSEVYRVDSGLVDDQKSDRDPLLSTHILTVMRLGPLLDIDGRVTTHMYLKYGGDSSLRLVMILLAEILIFKFIQF